MNQRKEEGEPIDPFLLAGTVLVLCDLLHSQVPKRTSETEFKDGLPKALATKL